MGRTENDVGSAGVAREEGRDVLSFAVVMARKLKVNSHKGGWSQADTRDLLRRLKEEVSELEAELASVSGPISPYKATTITRECADVANFAMMIASSVGGLK